MKRPVLVALGVAGVALVGAGAAIVLVRNGKPAAELPLKPESKRLIHPVHDIMHEEFGPGQYDPIEATGD